MIRLIDVRWLVLIPFPPWPVTTYFIWPKLSSLSFSLMTRAGVGRASQDLGSQHPVSFSTSLSPRTPRPADARTGTSWTAKWISRALGDQKDRLVVVHDLEMDDAVPFGEPAVNWRPFLVEGSRTARTRAA